MMRMVLFNGWTRAGLMFLLIQFAAARETTTPAAFELVFPGNNATAYATTYGDKVRLVWQESVDGGTDVDRYEIWMDGSKVDEIQAGEFGHLPGEWVTNYEPFRPFGFLTSERVYYYTPRISSLSLGQHQWYIKAVDGDGNERQSTSTFTFSIDSVSSGGILSNPAPNTKIFVNHTGYLSGGNNRVVVDASVGASTFDLVDAAGNSVYSGSLESGGSAFGDYLSGDFPGQDVSGTYRVKAGSEYSMWFSLGLEAEINYESYLRKYRNAYTRKRCGNTTVNWGRQACHLEDARMFGNTRHEIVGGWHASSDVRKIQRILQPGLTGLIELKRAVNPAWDSGPYSLFDEIKWGNQYIHKMQFESGAVGAHYFLWCDADGWGEKINIYTNNIMADADDRLLPDSTVIIDMVNQSRFIRNQTSIYRMYKNVDPAYAEQSLNAATRAYDYFSSTWPVVTDYETTFNARPYLEPVSDFMPLAYGVRVNLFMYLATGTSEYKDRAVALTNQLINLQETEYVAGQSEVKGFFYTDAGRDSIFTSLMAHGGMDGAEGGVIVLADMIDAFPGHADAPRWKESFRSYLEDNLLPLSLKNAFGVVPSYLSLVDETFGQGNKMARNIGGLYYQYLCYNRGVNKVFARKAILLAKGARILGNQDLADAAWRQINWIMGSNPLNRSTVYGVGHNQPNVYKATLAPRSDGVVVQGIGGASGADVPYMREGHWRWAEMELNVTAWLARAVLELMTPQPLVTSLAFPKNREGFQLQNSQGLLNYSGLTGPVVLPIYSVKGNVIKRVTLSDPSGSFQLKGIAGGHYYVKHMNETFSIRVFNKQ